MGYLDTKLPMLPPFKPEIKVSILAETADYNHRLMNIPSMWESTMGEGVKVAVLDTGVPKHVDLDIAGGKSFIDGYYEDVAGHALHVAGIIAAIAYNNMGIRGIAPLCKDYYGAVLDGDGAGKIEDVISGIYWAVDEIGADIINMSLGLPAGVPYIQELEEACKYAVKNGTTIFAAAGNEYGKIGQPAKYDCVYAVAAVDSRKRVVDFSNKGKEINFAAGGVDVFSTYLGNTYASLSGTSMATPALTGAAALIISDAMKSEITPRKLSPEEVGEKLRKICFDVGPKGFDTSTGHGIPMFHSSGAVQEVPTKKLRWYQYLLPWNWFVDRSGVF